MSLTLLASFALATASAMAPLPQERLVAGIIVCSTDQVLVKRVQSDFVLGRPYSEFERVFKDQRYAVYPWGTRSAILVDRSTPTLAQHEDRLRMIEIMVQRSSESGVIDVSRLPQDERDFVEKTIKRTFPLATFQNASSSIGVRPLTRVDLKAGDKYVRMRIPAKQRTANDLAQSLALSPVLTEGQGVPDADKKKLVRLAEEASLKDQQQGIAYFGIAAQNMPEGLKELSMRLDELLIGINQRISGASLTLTKKLLDADIPASTRFADLPASARDEISAQLEANWHNYGFATKEDALKFLASAPDASVATTLSLAFCTRKGPPPSFTAIEFGTAPGGASPP